METRLINTLKEHEERLTVLLNHRNLAPQLNSYIREFLLNDQFYALMGDIRAREEYLKNYVDRIESLANDGILNHVLKIFYYSDSSNDGGWQITFSHPITGDLWELDYHTKEDAMRDIEKVSEKYKIEFELIQEEF